MALKEKIEQIYEQTRCPVFTVDSGKIVKINHICIEQNIQIGDPVCDLIHTGLAEYNRYKGGTLYLTVKLNEKIYNATVVQCGKKHIFILDSDFVNPNYAQLCDLSTKLRTPLTNAMISLEMLEAQQRTNQNQQLYDLKKSLYQLHRILGNMASLPDYSETSISLIENLDLTELMKDLMANAEALIEKAGYKLKYSLPTRHILCSMNSNSIKRAIMNMLANAMKYSKASKSIHVKMRKIDDCCTISVTNNFTDPMQIDKFDQFSILVHDPLCRNGSDGVGLGLSIIRATASMHNGAILMERTGENTMTISLSIPVRIHTVNSKNCSFHTFKYRPIDHTGGYNLLLTELSDLLPAELFK